MKATLNSKIHNNKLISTIGTINTTINTTNINKGMDGAGDQEKRANSKKESKTMSQKRESIVGGGHSKVGGHNIHGMVTMDGKWEGTTDGGKEGITQGGV